MKNVYIHIPYCASKCPYCGFASVAATPPGDFMAGIVRDFEAAMARDPETPQTLYVGGGTPTCLPPEQLSLLRNVAAASLPPTPFVDGGKNAAATLKTHIITDSPKSASSIRDIPVPAFIAPMLMHLRRDAEAYFLSTPENPRTEPRTLQNHFKRIIKAAGIPDANFHCLRHTFSTLCVEADVDIKSLSEMLGHASVTITLNRYVHSTLAQKREGIRKLERYLNLT
ncbi:MAG: tyrosine-type recombinase/integrase [Kiritimatiellaeota bacterium]|nr:tyrosine-type recombinase/integrase [Kiritimatiellota bacterium]